MSKTGLYKKHRTLSWYSVEDERIFICILIEGAVTLLKLSKIELKKMYNSE